MICPSCNTTNRDDAQFCKGCGYSLRVEETAQQDLSLEPTLILSPEKMVAFHARRWNEEAQQGYAASPTISDIPTALAPSFHESEDASVPPPPPPESLAPSIEPSDHQQNSGEGNASAANGQGAYVYHSDNGGYPEVEASDAASPAPMPTDDTPAVQAKQEEAPEAEKTEEPGEAGVEIGDEKSDASETVVAAQAAEDGQIGQDFPVLSVGAVVIGRYEVTQLISDDPHDHVYHVVDHQGYQRCWSCGFEQNVEGDEFCGECGASLLNEPYIMHEYSLQETSGDALVLQGNIVNTFVEQGRTYAIEQPQAEQSAFPNGVCLESATASDAGNVRRSDPNEDSTLVMHFQRIHESISSPVGVFIVADGMGGHDNGQGASRMAINVIAERLARELLLAPLTAEKDGQPVTPFDDDALVLLLHGAVEDANNALCQKNTQEKSDMGSTLTGCMIVGEHAYIVNVGDSRTYMLRNKQLYQVTTDHSLVAQLVASGLIEPDDVYTHPQRSQIFRSLGDKTNLQIDIFKQQLLPGDILLACCDGLWEMVRNPQIESILNNAPDPQTACAQLIEAANAGGGEDNISAIVVFVR